MSPFLETITRLDAQDDVPGLLACIQQHAHDLDTLFATLLHILPTPRMRPAFILAMMLTNAGHRHPAISIALSVGGLIYGNPEEEARGLESLRAQVDALSTEQQAGMDLQIIYPVMVHLLQNALKQQDTAPMMRILEILRAATPRFRNIFDREATAPDLSRETLRQQGREKARLITYPRPPSKNRRQRRRVIISSWGVGDELGPHLGTAMHTYGWTATHIHCAENTPQTEGCQAVIEACREHTAEILILAMDQMMGIDVAGYTAMIQQLRQENPDIKIVGFLFDSWGGRAENILANMAAWLDVVWESTSPSLPLWQEPALAGKVLHVILPRQVHAPEQAPCDLSNRPLIPKLLFSGSVQGWNWPRAFWMTAIEHAKLPFQQEKSSTCYMTGLSPSEGHTFYRRYMERVAKATCCLNLTMRQNQECVVIGRSFDVPVSGSLLVQESTPEMDYYFVSGEHYLEFSTLAELSAVMRFITEHREEAEEIRRRGCLFARERYNDEAMIGYLDRFLYDPHHA